MMIFVEPCIKSTVMMTMTMVTVAMDMEIATDAINHNNITTTTNNITTNITNNNTNSPTPPIVDCTILNLALVHPFPEKTPTPNHHQNPVVVVEEGEVEDGIVEEKMVEREVGINC